MICCLQKPSLQSLLFCYIRFQTLHEFPQNRSNSQEVTDGWGWGGGGGVYATRKKVAMVSHTLIRILLPSFLAVKCNFLTLRPEFTWIDSGYGRNRYGLDEGRFCAAIKMFEANLRG